MFKVLFPPFEPSLNVFLMAEVVLVHHTKEGTEILIQGVEWKKGKMQEQAEMYDAVALFLNSTKSPVLRNLVLASIKDAWPSVDIARDIHRQIMEQAQPPLVPSNDLRQGGSGFEGYR